MFERFTPAARTVVVHAQDHARRLGHGHVGREHLLLAVAGSADPAGAVLREQGITPEEVEEAIVRRVGLGDSAALFGDLDRDALAAIGIDLEAVCARIVASFGPEALAGAAGRRRRAAPARVARRRFHRVHLLRRARRRRLLAAAAVPAATGLYRAECATAEGHLPFTPEAKAALADSVREARPGGPIEVAQLALGVIGANGGLVAQILAALGSSPSALRAAIADRYREAG